MESKNLKDMTDQELLEEAKRLKSFSVTNSFFIGFFVGIIVFSFTKNTWGFLTLIPLYFIYKMVNNPKNKRSKEVKEQLKERGLS